MSRTEAYQFTTNDRNDPRIKELKDAIKAINKLSRAETRQNFAYNRSEVGSLYRVRLMPRGPRVEAAWTDYKSKSAYDSYLPMRHATHFDVYIHRDTSSEYQLAREGKTGLTASQLRRLDREQHAHMVAGVEMHQRLREAGIYLGFDNEYISREKRVEEMRNRGFSETTIERLI